MGAQHRARYKELGFEQINVWLDPVAVEALKSIKKAKPTMTIPTVIRKALRVFAVQYIHTMGK
jgi:hypothetical protein